MSKLWGAVHERGRLVCFIYVPLCRRVFVLHLRMETPAARFGACAFLYDFTFASVPFMSRSMFER